MADVTVDLDYVTLFDLFPGVPDPRLGVPKDGFTGTDHHNVATAAYPLGTKIQVYNHSSVAGIDGPSVLVYCKLEAMDATNACKVKHICTQHSDAVYYDLTNEAATDIGSGLGLCAVALNTMTENYYGWFWCGGVCPEEYVPLLTGDIYCSAAAAIGGCMLADLETGGEAPGELGFATASGDTKPVVAYLSKAAD